MRLLNPCPINLILNYSKTVPFDEINNNEYINAIYNELLNITEEHHITKGMISAIFQLTMHYAGKENYIDIGCAILSFATLAKDKHDKIFIDLTNGAISIPNDFNDIEDLELKSIQEKCNSIKFLIIKIFSPKGLG